MTRTRPTVRAPRPNHIERHQRQAAIDALLQRALRGVLTVPEAALLAEYVRAEQRIAETTRRSLRDTTRALERHRAAADDIVQQMEARITELTDTHTQETAA